MTRKNIELVCFDLGGVLIRIVGGWAEACRVAGLPAHPLFETEGPEALNRAVHAMEVGELTPARFLEALCADADYTLEQAARVLDAWLLGMYEGVGGLLGRLGELDATLAILSNTNARHWRAIVDEAGPFAEVLTVPHRFASHEIGARKPAGAAFAVVEEAMGTDSRRILYFDDSPENVAGAARAGWNAELIDARADTVAQMTHHLRHYGVI